MSTDHIANREELINFIKADTVGPIKDTTKFKFKELDTSKKIVFGNRDEAENLFCDKETGEEILHMADWQFNPLQAYSSGILYPTESIIDEDGENDEKDTDRIEEQDSENQENKEQEKFSDRQEKLKNYKNIDEIQNQSIDIDAVNQRKPNAMAMSFHFELTEKTNIEITFSGGAYDPIPTYESSRESKRNIKNLHRPSDPISQIDLTNSNTWWVCCNRSFDLTIEKQKIFAPNDNYWHHQTLKEVKKGDVVLIYAKKTIKAISVVVEDAKIEENLDENIQSTNNNNEFISAKIKTFELAIPIDINDIDEGLKKEIGKDKNTTFTKNGIVDTHYCSPIVPKLYHYLNDTFKPYWPINSPWGTKYEKASTYEYSPSLDDRELNDESMWRAISEFENKFSFEQLKEKISESTDFEEDLLKTWLDRLVESGEINFSNNLYEISNKLTFFRTFYLRKNFEDTVSINSERIKKVKERGYVEPLDNDEFSKVICGVNLKYAFFVRKYNSAYIGTVVLENTSKNYGKESEGSLFQSKINLKVIDGKNSNLLPYPSEVNYDSENYIELENKTFEMLYSNNPVYAVGHGTSVGWNDSNEIFTETLPIVKLDNLTPDIKNSKTGELFDIDMLQLSESENYEKIEELLAQYEDWISELEKNQQTIDKKYNDVAEFNIEKCKKTLERMRKGLDLIQSNPEVKSAFQLSNKAMYEQQIRPSQARKIESINPKETDKTKRIIYDRPLEVQNKTPRWRPFQIAFFLLNIESIVNETSIDRENVELLWFPTGGGKTEAYLGIAAFTLFYQRIIDKDDDGTAVLMRYTLRLLTAQQFERASKLICSMEIIRKKNPELLGSTEFSIAIWVGGSTSPNTKKQAIENLKKLKSPNSYVTSLFILQSCPWCMAQIGKFEISRNTNFIAGIKKNNDTVMLHCSDLTCEFSESLPVYVTDEDIYEMSPSFIIATVDKIARVAWRPDARSIFGIGKEGDRTKKPPKLIIQDELHLISNALGSAVGFYETILEDLCIDSRNKVKPKIICSTATIRNSQRQLSGLYARERSTIFPPSGLSIDDSFFSKKDTSIEGKIYMGLFTPGFTTQQTQTNLYSATTQAMSLFEDSESKDPWITNLCYFGSMRELGTTYSLLSENIVRKLRFLHDKYQLSNEERVFQPYSDQVMELTSRLDSSEVVSTMQKLSVPLKELKETSITKFILATSIIEVGIDIQRLSLMTILNQPKNTSQYIQTSGRVGRDINKPGLIITIFSPQRPRDRSHYEKFKAYHQKLHSQVEPTSVTPFSDSAIKRMLKGAFFMYLGSYLPKIYFKDPELKFPEEEFERFKELIQERKEYISSEGVTSNQLDKYLNEIPKEWERIQATIYQDEMDNSLEDKPLILQADSWRRFREHSFLIPNSLRSVDQSARGEIITLPFED